MNTVAQRVKTLEQRFWEKVDKNGPVPQHVPNLGNCWVWTANCQKRSGVRSYGQIWHHKTNYASHRTSWEIHFGEIPSGLCVLHKCDNPACVRPEHLFVGTHKDNEQDKIKKGRKTKVVNKNYVRGESHYCAKLTSEDVLEIRSWRARGAKPRHIAAALGFRKTLVCAVIYGRTWKHVKLDS